MKFIFIVFFAFFFSKVDAQNLQFSQVLTYNLQPEESIFVPASKVWKIVSYTNQVCLHMFVLITHKLALGRALVYHLLFRYG